jgi:hypothetical protein
MPGHPLIEAFLADLRRRLPDDVVDELADGLTETYERHRVGGLAEAAAADAALAEFGGIGEITGAFRDIAPSRRVARRLIATGPVVGGLWAATLLTSHAWRWPIAVPLRVVGGVALLTVVTALVTAAAGRLSCRTGRRACTLGGLGVIVLDAAMLCVMAFSAPASSWLLAAAACASAARITATLRAVPAVLICT